MAQENYQKLKVWQMAMDIVTQTYLLCKRLPKEELYSLQDQMKRSAVSIPSNIAEGQGRNSIKEFIRFLFIARGSKAELETQLLICVRLNFLSESDIAPTLLQLEEVSKMLSKLVSNLKTKL
ncbi:MAG: four helix bundle protein [Chitinophagales bacterium]|nr:four helix bundle protein [Chitinophagales bacterium]